MASAEREYSEQDPLLRDSPPPSQRQKTPLPRLQLLLVLNIQFAEPVLATVIFPFINQLVRETGITGGDERRTGYYAGIIESSFFLTECITVYQWGKLSDNKRIGRKPVLLVGQALSAITVLTFGLSNKFWMLLLCRSLLGSCNGNIGVTKSVMAEITDSTNIADAVAFSPIIWAFGATVGPIIGGVFSRPADRWPIFDHRLFKHFPYFLACAVAALIPLGSFISTFIWLKETLPAIVEKKKNRPSPHTSDAETAGDSNTSEQDQAAVLQPDSVKKISMRKLLLNERIWTTLANCALLSLLEQSHAVLMPLMYSTSIQNGGLGFSSYKIGLILGTVGLVNGTIQLCLFSKCLEKFGPKRLYTAGYCSLLIAIATYPVMSTLAKSAGTDDAKVWVALIIQLCCHPLFYMAFSCSFIYVINAAPDRGSLGATNGLSQMASTIVRTIAPSLASTLFSISLEKGVMGGHMVYWALCAIGSIGIYTATWLPQALKQ